MNLIHVGLAVQHEPSQFHTDHHLEYQSRIEKCIPMVTKISVGKDKPILCCNVINEETQNRESYNANKIGPSESLVAHVTHMSRSTDMKSPKKGQVTVYSYFRLSKKAMLRT